MNNPIRLNSEEIRAIKQAILSLDSQAQIYLFGSRTDMAKKGGDIDLLILSSQLTWEDRFRIKVQLFQQLDEQKIDLVLAQDTSDPLVKIALQQGIQL